MVPPVGIIITVSVLVAAGIAAYQSPQVQEWLDQSRQKIAMVLHSLGDDINPRSRSPRPDDPSMREDGSELAELRRRQARAEILERGRIMEERRKRRKTTQAKPSPSTSFDAEGADDRRQNRSCDHVCFRATCWPTRIEEPPSRFCV